MFRSNCPKSVINSQYYLCGTPLDANGNIRDLGFILYSDLSFNSHVDAVYNKSLLH